MDRGEGLTLETAFATEQDLRAFAEAFGGCLHGGDVVGLVGTLGAGKTVFTQSLARGLLVPADVPVISPTFVLHRRYSGRCRLEHVDAYRLRSGADFLGLDAASILEGGGVVVIEWAEKVKELLPAHTIWIHFEVTGPSERRVTARVPALHLLAVRTGDCLQSLVDGFRSIGKKR